MITALGDVPTTTPRLETPLRGAPAAVSRALVRVPAWAALTALITVSTALRFWAARDVPVPWIAPDEMIYGTLGQSLYRAGQLRILDGPTPFYSLVYPALNGTVLAWGDLEKGYAVLKALQALVMSLAAVPVYLWGRSFMARPWALLAAALTIAIPGLVYSGLVMSEVAFYPVLVLAFWALANALVHRTLGNQALLVGAVLLACGTRLQAVVLVPVLVTAVALKALFDRRVSPALQLWPAFAALAGVAVAWISWRLAHGGPWNNALAGYAAAGDVGYSVVDALQYIAYHIGDLFLMTGLFPACALVLVVISTAVRREPSERVRAFVAVAVAAPLWLVIEVGTFASRHVDRLAERNLLPAAPLLFLALALWLDRGAERPRVLTSVVAIAAAIPILALPIERLINEGALPDAFSFVPFYRLLQRNPDVNLGVVIFGGATVVAALFVLLPRKLLVILPFALIAALAATSYAAGRYVEQQATLQRTQLVGPDRRWIDDAVPGRRVAYIYDGDFYWNAVWEHVFWNRSLASIYDLPRKHVPGPLPQSHINVLGDGRVLRSDGTPAPERYAVASMTFKLVGKRVTSIATPGTEQLGLSLWRLRPPFRLATAQAGLRPNGEIRGRGRLVAYACRGGSFLVKVVALTPLRFELHMNGRQLAVFRRPPHTFTRLLPGESWSGSVAATPSGPPGRSTCTFDIFTSDAMYATRFAYRRASPQPVRRPSLDAERWWPSRYGG